MSPVINCPVCQGNGQLKVPWNKSCRQNHNNGGKCRLCNGTGKVVTNSESRFCIVCGGSGRRWTEGMKIGTYPDGCPEYNMVAVACHCR